MPLLMVLKRGERNGNTQNMSIISRTTVKNCVKESLRTILCCVRSDSRLKIYILKFHNSYIVTLRNNRSNNAAFVWTHRCLLPLALHNKLQAAELFEEQEPQKQQQRTLHVSNTDTHIDVGLIEVEVGKKTQR